MIQWFLRHSPKMFYVGFLAICLGVGLEYLVSRNADQKLSQIDYQNHPITTLAAGARIHEIELAANAFWRTVSLAGFVVCVFGAVGVAFNERNQN